MLPQVELRDSQPFFWVFDVLTTEVQLRHHLEQLSSLGPSSTGGGEEQSSNAKVDARPLRGVAHRQRGVLNAVVREAVAHVDGRALRPVE